MNQRYSFRSPEKCINNPQDLERFLETNTHSTLLNFIKAINFELLDSKDSTEKSPAVSALLDFFLRLFKLVEPMNSTTQCRYGDPMFRIWQRNVFDEVQCCHTPFMTNAHLLFVCEALLTVLLPEELLASRVELIPYLMASFGDPVRLDYGTGHELSFVCFLLCCYILEIFSVSDLRAIGSEVFPTYIALVRALLHKFRLEPAGSRGVWGLDDYFFLPFYWGSAQLVNHEFLIPSSIHDAQLVAKFKECFMYFSSIAFIMESKSASLTDTSPMLVDISQIRTWKKINNGMLKMYQGECLSKLPVMRHFVFGSILPFE